MIVVTAVLHQASSHGCSKAAGKTGPHAHIQLELNGTNTVKALVWHDNEKFLLQPKAYKANRLEMVRFPPNSGDLNPIETVWARLRKDLAVMEMRDMSQTPRRELTVPQFKTRASNLFNSYAEVKRGPQHSYLQKLIHGMPRRLQKCKDNLYGRCGK